MIFQATSIWDFCETIIPSVATLVYSAPRILRGDVQKDIVSLPSPTD
jgi:hypothetical protein